MRPNRKSFQIKERRHSNEGLFKKLKASRSHGIQRFFLIATTAVLIYELFIQIFVFPLNRGIILDNGGSHQLHSQTQKYPSARCVDWLTMEIFSAPKPFIGSDKDVTLRAIRSWQNLSPKPKITLLGFETGYDEISSEYGLYIRSDVDKTFLGVPLFNSMLHVANESTARVAVIINGDIILLQNFITTLCTVLQRFKDFLLISARYDLPELPPDLVEGDTDFYTKLGTHARAHGALHTYGGMDLWAWNPLGPRLFDPVMPHFIFGRGKYDNWLTHETIAAGRRAVIDASEAVLSIHIRHDYKLVEQRDQETVMKGRRQLLSQGTFWSENKKSKFELFINIYLSLNVGTYKNQYGSIIFAPWRLACCLEPRGLCFLRRVRPGVCNCEYAPFSAATQTDEVVVNGSRIIRCGAVSREEAKEYEIPVTITAGENTQGTFGMPLTLSSIAERIVVDGTVIITALNYGYRDMMMNWVCNMRRLRVTNFVIAALDTDLYRFAFVRGLPVYFDSFVLSGQNVSLRNAAYGSPEFRELTKLKSRVVLELLKLGYDTLWTDTDIVWFRNPIAQLQALGADLAIQSNAPDNEAANGKRRLNSGFYLARANARTITVFEDIISFAARSRMSEQPCFYDVICGKNGERRKGNDSCEYKEFVAKVLDRTLYPNGITQGIWDVPKGTLASSFSHVFIVHNNWIKGPRGKWERFKRHGFVFYSQDDGLCRYSETNVGPNRTE